MDDMGVDRVMAALARGKLRLDGLTARRLSACLGKTTGALYHRWGSLDGLLFAVGQAGFEKLGRVLAERLAEGADLGELCAAFVRFGLDNAALYDLMFQRRYDWAELRRRGATAASPGLELWRALAARLAASGSANPEEDARLLYAGLHGLVSLAASGRANVGVLGRTDREVAEAAARTFARRICLSKGTES